MKQLALFLISFFYLFLCACNAPSNKISACGGSNSDNNRVSIGYLEGSREYIAPARWEFQTIERDGESIVSYQWYFSDDSLTRSSAPQGPRIEHTFSEPGEHSVCLRYRTSKGIENSVEASVFIESGGISGTINAALDNLVDVDTRDPYEPSANNDSFEQAQALSASARLSGIVDHNDREDYYQMQLQQYQRIRLQVSDESSAENYEQILLELFNAVPSPSDQTEPVISIKTESLNGRLSSAVVVPEKGSYFIKVTAINPRTLYQAGGPRIPSHGNYSLSIDAPVNSTAKNYAVGEVNIMLKSERQYQAQGLSSKMDLGRIKTLTLDNAQAFLTNQNINVASTLFDAGFNSALTLNSALNSGSNTQSKEEQLHWQMLQVIEALKAHPDILYAEPNWKRYPTALAQIDDPFYSSQWHYDTINVEQAWQAMGSRGDNDVIVAVLDTGVLTAHPDLTNNLITGYDFVDNDANANDPGDKSINGQRSSFHGTHVAGTIAASAANGAGGVGIAANVKVMPIRVLGRDGGFASDIMAGVCYAAKLTKSNSSVCNNVNAAASASDIINLSLGGPGFSDIEQALYRAVTEQGIIVIAAAGNESTSNAFYPAAYNKVISVAAINRNLEQASYSNFGSTVDVAAPGGDFSVDSGIFSAWGDDNNGPAILTYGSLQGTSMAAPHVAGVAALMKSVRPELTHNEFLAHLNAGHLTQDLGATGRDDIFGQGLIDAHKAVLQVQGDLAPQILSSNNQLFFNVSQTVLDFVLTSAGVGSDSELGDISVRINGANIDGGGRWLSLNKFSGLGRYQVSVDRTELSEGSYRAELVVSSSLSGVADIVLSVQLQVGNSEVSANAGVQYVLVIDEDAAPDENGNLYSVGGSQALIANNGKYEYQIYGLKKGRYLVSTGSDLDFDNVICDAGESCGQYPTLEQPKAITISEEQPYVEVNMSVNYLDISRSNLGLASEEKIKGFSVYKVAPDNTPVSVRKREIRKVNAIKVNAIKVIKVIKGN